MSGNNEKPAVNRDKVIIRTSIIGILANVVLAAFKAVVGIVSNSIAVTLDAVNNLSDALSSVITIIGTKLAGKSPNRKHPLGYGRIEYLSAMIVAGIVLYAGITAMVESVKKIIHPEAAEYTIVSLIIIAVAIVVKLLLGGYVKAQGKKVNSGSLIASGSDATFDAILSASVLVSAIIYMTTGFSLEAYVGAIIAIFIIKAGIEMMIETLNDILGVRADKELTGRVKELLCEEEEVRGAYDLIIYNYGPDRNLASVHLEVPDSMTAEEFDRLTRRAEAKVFKETGIILAGVSVYAYNEKDDEAARIRDDVCEKVMAHDWAVQFHGFYIDMEKHFMRFDVVFSFDINAKEGLEILKKEIGEAYPEYDIMIAPDIDVSD